MATRHLLFAIALWSSVLPPYAGGEGTRSLQPGRNDLMIPIGGDSLDATIFLPSAPPPDSLGYPAMLFVHGFGQTKHADTLSASLWARSGYATFCYSVRGHGNSGGASEIMGPSERRDLREIVAFLRSVPGVNPARIGIQGGSQGGLHVLWGAVDSLPIAAGTADVISPTWASDLTESGSYRTALTFLLFNTSIRYAPVADTLRLLLRADEHAALRTRLAAGRDVDTAALFAAKLPIAAFAKWQDHYFSVKGMGAWFQRSGAPRQLYCGTGGHFSDDVLAEFQVQWLAVNRWHEKYVAGKENGIDGVPSLTLATSVLPADSTGRFTWEREVRPDWPAAGFAPYRLYFTHDTLLSPLRPGGGGDSVVIANVWNPSYSFDSALADRFAGVRFESSLPRAARRFITRPIQNDVLWFGAPRVHYTLRSENDRFPFHCQIYEVDQNGAQHLVNRVPLTVRGWVPGMAAVVEAEGFLHSHRFTRGSRIAIELTNIDTESRPAWGTMPFHLPMFRNGSATLYCDSSRVSFIEFPFCGDPVLRTVVADLRVETEGSLRRVRISWSTLGECDNSGFQVMRRSGGGTEVVAGTLPPAGGGNSPAPLAYLFEDSTVEEGAWTYWVRQVDGNGRSTNSEEVQHQVLFTGVGPGIAHRFGLEQNYPNPFNPETMVRFTLSRGEHVRLEVVSILGERIEVLTEGDLPPGSHSVRWNARRFAGGAYLLRLSTPSGVLTRRMMILR